MARRHRRPRWQVSTSSLMVQFPPHRLNLRQRLPPHQQPSCVQCLRNPKPKLFHRQLMAAALRLRRAVSQSQRPLLRRPPRRPTPLGPSLSIRLRQYRPRLMYCQRQQLSLLARRPQRLCEHVSATRHQPRQRPLNRPLLSPHQQGCGRVLAGPQLRLTRQKPRRQSPLKVRDAPHAGRPPNRRRQRHRTARQNQRPRRLILKRAVAPRAGTKAALKRK